MPSTFSKRAHDRVAVLGAGRRDAEAAVAHDHARDPVPARRREVAVPEDLGVVVGVDVDEAGRQHQPVEVDHLGARRRRQLAGRRDARRCGRRDRHVGRPGRAAGPVDQRGLAQQQVHGGHPSATTMSAHIAALARSVVWSATVDDRLMYRRELYIGGAWVPPSAAEVLGVVSPSTEEVVGEVPLATGADIDRAVAAARTAFDDGPWPRMAPDERADVLARAAELLRKREADIAGVTVDEMGCADQPGAPGPDRPGGPRVRLLRRADPHLRARAQGVTGDRAGLVTTRAGRRRRPRSCRGTPRSPWPPGRLAPALAAGCTVVLKPPPEAPLTQLRPGRGARRGRAARRASSTSSPAAATSASTSSPTRASTRSPSPARPRPAGGSCASAATSVKRVSLELGGKSAAIVLDDADLATVGRPDRGRRHAPVTARCAAPTPGCSCPARRYDEAVDALAAAAAGHARRRPARPGHRRRPAGRRAPARPGRGLHRLGRRRGRPGRRPAAAGPTHLARGLVRRADDLRRRRQRDAGRPGGDLRPGPRRHPLRRRRRRRPHRQRLATTACPAACGPRTPPGRSPSPGGCAPAASASTALPAVPAGALRRLQGSRASAASSAPRAWPTSSSPAASASHRPSPDPQPRSWASGYLPWARYPEPRTSTGGQAVVQPPSTTMVWPVT